MLHLEVLAPSGRTRPTTFAVSDLVLAGFSARDTQARDAHIEELRELGIEPPSELPSFWSMSPELVSTASRLRVQGHDTSGEVEFVLLFAGNETFVGVGSDQTDRVLEAHSIPRSKQVCGKVLGRTVVRLDDVLDVWDDITLRCDVYEADGGWRPYQEAALATVLPVDELVTLCFGPAGPAPGTILMSGTIPLLDGVTRYLSQYRCAMRIPGFDQELAFHYAVEVLPDRTN